MRDVARVLEENCRVTDFVARYGGEEFVLLLPNTDEHGSYVLAENIRKAVERNDWQERPISVSVGAATMTTPHADGMELIQQADSALYRSKKAGRNCVHHASQSNEIAVVADIGGHCIPGLLT